MRFYMHLPYMAVVVVVVVVVVVERNDYRGLS